jgi:hypothetical protein
MNPARLTPITPRPRGGKPSMDLTGQRFGRLVAVREAGRHSGRTYWEARCDCGGTTYRTAWELRGDARSCGCAHRYAEDQAAKAAMLSRYRGYQREAAKRGLSFDLSLAQFQTLTAGACFYCGVPPAQVHRRAKCNGVFIYNGLDRKDSRLGYTWPNCVAACFECNRIKRAVPFNEFTAWLDRVTAYRCGRP